MLKSFEHVGMTVSDMDRSVDFYCGLLGLRLHLRKRMADGTEIAFLDAGGGMLDIFAPGGGAARAVDVPEGTAGLQKTGVEVKERPRLAINAEVLHKVAFVRDPDGIQIELAEKR